VSRRSALLLSILVAALSTGCSASPDAVRMPSCEPGRDVIALIAQSVPSATQLPCVAQIPAGWSYDGQEIQSGLARFWLDSDIGGVQAVQVDLQPGCDVSGAIRVPSTAVDEVGLERFDKPEQVRPLRLVRYYRFQGGCIIYRYSFAPGTPSSLQFQADEAVSFLPREAVVASVRHFGFNLCGAGVRCAG
jgi:hypothetical protein